MQFKNSKLLTVSVFLMLILVLTPISISGVSTCETYDECYGFIVPVNQYQSNKMQMNISKLVNELLINDVDVYWITNQINVSVKTFENDSIIKGKNFDKGSYIVSFDENNSLNAIATNIIYKYHIKNLVKSYMLLESIDNIDVYKLSEPKIAIHNGPAVDAYNYANFLRESGFLNYDFLSWDEIPDELNNDDYNVLIWGGSLGGSKYTIEKNFLNFENKDAILKVREFLSNGGGYVGSCLGQMMASKNIITPLFANKPFNLLEGSFSIGCNYTVKSFRTLLFYNLVFPSGIAMCKITNFNSPIAYGLNESIPMWHYQGPIPRTCGDDTEAIGVFDELIESEPTNKPVFLKKLVNKIIQGSPNIISSKYGQGKVVTYNSHPEKYYYLDDIPGYTSPIRLVHNSIFYVTSTGLHTIEIDNKSIPSDLGLEIIAPYSANVSDLIDFQSNVNNGTSPYSYYWDFGDGYNSDECNPIYKYQNPGNFLVTITVIDKDSRIDTCTFEINISGESAIENHPPEKPVSFYGYVEYVKPGEIIFFRVKSVDTDGDFFCFNVTGVNESVDEEYIKNRYVESNQYFEFFNFWQETGNYYIKVKAIDEYGAESEWSDPIEIIVTKTPIISRILST